MIAGAALALLPLLLAVAQIHPPECAVVPGNDAIVLTGIAGARDRCGLTVDAVPAQTIRGVMFRPAFRDSRPGAYAACAFDVEIRASYDGQPAAQLAWWDQHNRGTVQTVLPQSTVNFPAVASLFSQGGVDAWVPEPFAYGFTFAMPFSVPHTANVHLSLQCFSPTRGDVPAWDAVFVDYQPAAVPAPFLTEVGAFSTFRATRCGTDIDQTHFAVDPWSSARAQVALVVDGHGEPGAHVLFLAAALPSLGGPFTLPGTGCTTWIGQESALALLVPPFGCRLRTPLVPECEGALVLTHWIVVDGGAITRSYGTRAHRVPLNWHAGRTPDTRTQFTAPMAPGIWSALVAYFQ